MNERVIFAEAMQRTHGDQRAAYLAQTHLLRRHGERETMTIKQSAWTGMVPVDDTALYVSDTGGRGRPVVYLNGAYADQSLYVSDTGGRGRPVVYLNGAYADQGQPTASVWTSPADTP